MKLHPIRKLRFFDPPKRCDTADYQRALDFVLPRLQDCPEVISVYQIGGISTPGISDIDLVVVVKDAVRLGFDPRGGLSSTGRYLFAHSLYGVPERLLHDAIRFTAFHNYKRMHGKELSIDVELSPDQRSAIEKQTAFEFLLRAYMVTSYESCLGICKVRSLLLHTKALSYDFEFLGVEHGPLIDMVRKILVWRTNWFDSPPTKDELGEWLIGFQQELKGFLIEQFERHSIWLPGRGPFRVLRNVELMNGSGLSFCPAGPQPPKALAFFGSHYIKLVNRVCRFQLVAPFRHEAPPPILSDRFECLRKLKEYNRRFLPQFYPMTSSLNA